MHLRTSLRVLALAVLATAPVFAQQTKAKRAAAPAADAPAAAPSTTPTTLVPSAPAQRDELTPEQKASMKEADRMRGEKARIDAELASLKPSAPKNSPRSTPRSPA